MFKHKDKLLVYRHIQLVANLLNEVQQKIIVPTSIGISITISGVSLALLTSIPATTENLLLLLFMRLVWINTSLFLIFGLRVSADVQNNSVETMHRIGANLRYVTGDLEKKWVRRFAKSCGIIKIKFGGNNFVDSLTPLRCISHSLQITVQILLLDKNH